MLLSTCSSSNAAVTDEQSNPFSEYLRSVSGQEKEQDVIATDHNYSKLWSSHPDSQHTKPARMLFLKGFFQRNDALADVSDCVVDVESVAPPTVPPFDTAKNRALSLECDQFLMNSLPSDDLEEKEIVNKTGWSATQKNLYKHVMKVIHGNRLSRLCYSGSSTELVKRRVTIDKAAGKIRQLFAANTWDMKLLCWLHRTLLDYLSIPLLSEYVEILKALKVKIPNLMDKMLSQLGTYHSGVFGATTTEVFNQLLRKPWDPVFGAVSQHKPNKLPGNPLILVVPSSPNQTPANQSQRMRFWNSQLSALGKVVQLPIHTSSNIAVDECLNQIFTMARNKVVEIRSHSPKRPTILLGWNIGAIIACHVALEEPVTSVICLGFPLKGVGGSRGDLDDPLLDSKVPTLFVIGQNSSTCSMDDMEDFRERMRAETGLVVVGGADDLLRVSVTKKKSEGITQAMVDRCLVDELGDFLTPVLNQQCSSNNAAPQPAATKKAAVVIQEQQVAEDGKRQRRRPREYSPEISPIKKKARTVGRPSLQKVLSTSSSSDTSSVGSCASEGASKKDVKFSMVKSNKHEKMLAKNQAVKNSVQSQQKTSESSPGKEKTHISLKADVKKESPPLPTASPIPSATAKMTPAKILAEQQKNGPVDVEKAFGKDSSFLPRPLTPAELDGSDTAVASSVQSEKSLDLGLADGGVTPESDLLLSPSSQNIISVANKPVAGVTLSSILGSPERQKISYLKTSTGNYPLTTFSTHVSSTVAIQKPQVVAKISESIFDSTKTCITPIQKLSDISAGTSNLSVSAPQTKILKSGSINVKQVQGIVASLGGKGMLASTSSSPSKSQTVLVGSPTTSKPATFLMQSSESTLSPTTKIQFRRMLVQGSQKLPVLSKLASTAGASDETKPNSGEQRVCNLSLLSDVAGMKEPIRQMVHDAQASTANATLVKLTSSDGGPSSLRRIRVIEAISPAASQPQRLETPEELAEKQMAIRALSSSLNEDNDSNMNYNISPHTKTDGNFTPRSAMLGYSIVVPKSVPNMGLRPTYRRGRGRLTPGFPLTRKPRIQRFYPF